MAWSESSAPSVVGSTTTPRSARTARAEVSRPCADSTIGAACSLCPERPARAMAKVPSAPVRPSQNDLCLRRTLQLMDTGRLLPSQPVPCAPPLQGISGVRLSCCVGNDDYSVQFSPNTYKCSYLVTADCREFQEPPLKRTSRGISLPKLEICAEPPGALQN